MKRTFDVIAAGLGLIVLSPLLAAIALLVLRDIGGPVLFRQIRAGLHGRPFTLYKFRTMRGAPDPRGAATSDGERMTDLGRALRSWSLDELPELWNVLLGEMSIVGPRPLLVEYLPRYNETQARRHEVRPGITGLAQIRGRNCLSWDERFALDVEYVDTHSILLDLRILAETVLPVLRRDGISHEGSATMHEFTGSRPEKEQD